MPIFAKIVVFMLFIFPLTNQTSLSAYDDIERTDLIKGVTTAKLNFRAGPGINFKIIETLKRGEPVEINQAESQDNWLFLYYKEVPGWVSKKYIKIGFSLPAPQKPSTKKPAVVSTPKSSTNLIWVFVFIIGFVILPLLIRDKIILANYFNRLCSLKENFSFSPENVSKIILVLVLVLAGGFLFFLNYKKEPPKPQKPKEIRSWTYKTNLVNGIYFNCKAQKIYNFIGSAGIKGVRIVGFGYHRLNLSGFNFRPNKDTRVVVYADVDGLLIKSGRLDINMGANIKYQSLYLFSVNEYSNLTINVKKGDRLELSKFNDIVFLYFFKEGKEQFRKLVRRNREYTRVFWDSYTIKIKAAEVPFSTTDLKVSVYKEPFYIYKRPVVTTYSYHAGNAFLLNPGDVVTTPLWLDKEDSIWLDGPAEGKIAAAFPGGWRRIPGSNSIHTVRIGKVGYLKIKGLEKCVFKGVAVYRNKKWHLELKPGETKKIEIFSGDVLGSSCRSRYYVNGNLLEPVNHTHTGDTGHITFKGSVDSGRIEVWVIKRRGF
jgi:hypothetical protein